MRRSIRLLFDPVGGLALIADEGEVEMSGYLPTDQGWAKAEVRLRAILSSWHQSRRYRPEASQYRNNPVRSSRQTDLNREFKKPRYTEWQWFLIPLLAFTVIDYLCFPLPGWR